MTLKNQCMKVNLCYLSCDCCIHFPTTRDLYDVLHSCGMRETYLWRFILHDVRYVLCLKADLRATSGIQIHSVQNFCSNSIVCLIFHLIFSLCLIEVGNSDSDSVVCDLGNFDLGSVVCVLHLSEGYLDCSLFLGDLYLFLCLSLC
jgi:hypothetical protein